MHGKHLMILAALVLAGFGTAHLAAQAPPPAPAVDADPGIANGYDDAWEVEWVAHLREIHKRAKNKTDGFVIHLGDSITHYAGYSQFALKYQAADELGQTVKWSKAGGPDTDQAAPDCKNGWSLTYTQVKAENPRWRSYTACKGITVHEFLYGATKAYCFVAGPTDTAPLDTLLNNTSTAPVGGPDGYPVAIVADAEVAVIMLGTNDVGGSAAVDTIAADMKTMIAKLEARDIMPVLTTIPPRKDAAADARVVALNKAYRDLARECKVPLIDFQAEILRRQPAGAWFETLVGGDGVHLTEQNYQDPVRTPAALSTSGNLLRGFLTVAKLMEVKKYVIDGKNPPQAGPARSDKPVFTITTEALPAVKVGERFQVQLETVNGTEPIRWTATGLKDGFMINKSGIIDGSPTKAGTYEIAVKAVDRRGSVARRVFVLTVTG